VAETPLPRARALSAQPVRAEGQTLILVKDPLGIIAGPLLLRPEAYLILSLLDGRTCLRDLQVFLQRQLGRLVFSEEIEAVLARLDESLLLESERFEAHLAQAGAEFERAECRPASHAGVSYPAQAGELKALLESILAQARPEPIQGLTGLIAPHIDFARGARVYAEAYQVLPRESGRLCLALGTCHQPTRERYVVLAKDFETPLGRARTRSAPANRLAALAGGRFSREALVHRDEHSLEFQVVFLQHLLGPEVPILPVLCGGLAEASQGAPSPGLDEAAEEFLAVLVEIAAQEEALVVMGADLAHIGPQFGQSQPVSRSDLVRLKEQDLALLDRAAEGDAAGFYASVAAERDRRNICGLAPIYAGLRIMGPVKGRLLGWDAWLDEKGRGSVSFAALAFERI